MPSPPTRDLGSIDWASAIGSSWVDINETVPDLTWPLSVQMFGRMRRDPRLTAILNGFFLPIRRATWAVDGAGCRDEVVQAVADDLSLPILGADLKPGAARRRGVQWTDHLRLALLKLVYGHAGFERRYEIRNGLARLVNLGERPQWTISAIDLNRDGTIEAVNQNYGSASAIAANRLLWYVNDREGANWSGTSVLRPAYGPWLLKHEMWRVHATSIRRFGMGVPSVTAPAGATPAQVMEASRLASAARVGDQSGAGMPNGFEFKLTGLTGSVPDAMAFIQYLDQQLSTSALAGFLDLGQTATGSRALGDSFIDLFMLSLQTIADTIADEATSGQPGLKGIVTDLVDLNWGEDEPAPRIICTDVGDRGDLSVDAINGLIGSGAITPDAELEGWLRTAYRLPAKAPATTAVQLSPPPAPTAVAAKRRKQAKAREVRAAGDPAAGHRQLTTIEAASGMDPDAIQESWQTALDELIANWQTISAAQQAELATQVSAAIAAGELAALAALTVTTDAAAELIASAMIAVAGDAAVQMIAEAASQGVKIALPDVDTDRLTEVASTVATLMGDATATTAGREALRVAGNSDDGDAVAQQVTDHLASLTDAWPREQLGGALTGAQNHGRRAAIDAAPTVPVLASSEVLDANTCQPCSEIDGTEFETLAAADAAYPSDLGGYVGCLGGLRCRGITVAIWRD